MLFIVVLVVYFSFAVFPSFPLQSNYFNIKLHFMVNELLFERTLNYFGFLGWADVEFNVWFTLNNFLWLDKWFHCCIYVSCTDDNTSYAPSVARFFYPLIALLSTANTKHRHIQWTKLNQIHTSRIQSSRCDPWNRQ